MPKIFAAFFAGFLLQLIFVRANSGLLFLNAKTLPQPQIRFNEDFQKQLRESRVNLDNIDEVFDLVYQALKSEVNVYPTENYYYFSFLANGKEVWGNLRLDSIDRNAGQLSFAYFFKNSLEPDHYIPTDKSFHKTYDKSSGLAMTEVNKLTYRLAFKGKIVTFHLNNLEQIIPKNSLFADQEIFAGRISDESGLQFFLVFNAKTNSLFYILDETVPLADTLVPFGAGIHIGRLSGFAFFEDRGRKVLFAVNQANVQINNYYDGPFDQLADNFVDENKFEQLLFRTYPYFIGKVKGRGDFLDEKGQRNKQSRISISAYHSYSKIRDVWDIYNLCSENYGKNIEEKNSCLTNDQKYSHKSGS